MNQKNEQQPKQPKTPADVELAAIRRIRAILAELPPTARQRVLGYVADRATEERWAGVEVPPTLGAYQADRMMESAVAPPPVAGLAKASRSE